MNTNEFTAALTALKPYKETPPDNTWDRHRFELRKHALVDDPTKFLTWSTIEATMFVGNADYVHDQWLALANSKYADRFDIAIREYDFGAAERLPYAPLTSGNMVNQAYHLLQWMTYNDKDIKDINTIVELGAGYGTMCTVARRMGFTGKYVIYDNLDFSLLQQFYLSNIGMDDNVVYKIVDDQDRFDVPPTNTDLLIACYSLSEVSEPLRTAFFGMVSPKYCLVAYQPEFGVTKDLKQYMRTFANNRVNKYEFVIVKSKVRLKYGDEYMFGIRIV